MKKEVEACYESITEQALEHIQSNDVILTYGQSQLLENFFKEAKNEIYFEVVVCETAPTFVGHVTAENLVKEGINTTLVSDSAVYAVMSRVNKVIFSAHAIMANGGLVTHSGAHMIALAAQAHSVPVIVVGAMYKLTPLYPFDFMTFNEMNSPLEIFQLEENDKKE